LVSSAGAATSTVSASAVVSAVAASAVAASAVVSASAVVATASAVESVEIATTSPVTSAVSAEATAAVAAAIVAAIAAERTILEIFMISTSFVRYLPVFDIRHFFLRFVFYHFSHNLSSDLPKKQLYMLYKLNKLSLAGFVSILLLAVHNLSRSRNTSIKNAKENNTWI